MSTKQRILFVDDDRDFLSAQHAYFTSRGYDVLTADSSENACEMLQTKTPDLIFLDLMMEHYDTGFTLSYKIRKDPKFTHIPIVMLSGVAAQTGHRFNDDGRGLQQWSKVDLFLDKPVTALQLLRVVHERLGAETPDKHR